MAIKLTESRLRQIIREEARRLAENQGALTNFYLTNDFNRDILDLADEWSGMAQAHNLPNNEKGLNDFMSMIQLTRGGKPVDAATVLKVKSALSKELNLGKKEFYLTSSLERDILDLADEWSGMAQAHNLPNNEKGLNDFMSMIQLTRGGKPVDAATEREVRNKLAQEVLRPAAVSEGAFARAVLRSVSKKRFV